MTLRSPSAPDRLLEAAVAEFARLGKAGARTGQIATKAGVNKQLIHYYFGTKEGLYQQALAHAGSQVAEALARIPLVGLTAVERLRRLVQGQFDFLLRHPDLAAALTKAEEGGRWADAAMEPVVTLLTEGQATGFFRDDLDALHHARVSLLLNLGYFALAPIARQWGDPTVWRDRAADLIVHSATW